MKTKIISLSTTLVSLFSLFLGACQPLVVHHGSVLSITGTIPLQAEDNKDGELCIQFTTIENTPDDAKRKSETQTFHHCFRASVTDGKINLKQALILNSHHTKLQISSVEKIE